MPVGPAAVDVVVGVVDPLLGRYFTPDVGQVDLVPSVIGSGL